MGEEGKLLELRSAFTPIERRSLYKRKWRLLMAQAEYERNLFLTTQANESVFQGSQNPCPEKNPASFKTQE